jgi:DNA repair exonuclease SbcCD ATPase subunit
MGKTSTIVLASTAVLMVISIGFFAAMGVRLISKVNQLDATVMTVGKRAVELNTSLESLGLMGEKIAELTVQQEQLAKSQTELEQRIAATLASSTESVQKVPEALAKQMAASTSGVTKQVEGLGAQLKTQAGAVQALSKDVKALQSTVGDVNVLKRDVQALVTLQRERYLEQLQKQAAAAQEAKRPPPVQFPRPAPPTSPTAAPGANAPAQ